MRKERYDGNGIFTVAKAAGIALAISVLGAVIFAAVLRIFNIRESVVYPINQVMKGIALIVGTLIGVRGEKGWLKGGIAGLLFTSLSYLAFSALGGNFSLSWLIFAELILAFVIGGIGGTLAVNLKKS